MLRQDNGTRDRGQGLLEDSSPEWGENGGRVVGAGTNTRSHTLRVVENSSVLTIWMENTSSPTVVVRSFPKYYVDVQIRTSFMVVRKFETRCLVV